MLRIHQNLGSCNLSSSLPEFMDEICHTLCMISFIWSRFEVMKALPGKGKPLLYVCVSMSVFIFAYQFVKYFSILCYWNFSLYFIAGCWKVLLICSFKKIDSNLHSIFSLKLCLKLVYFIKLKVCFDVPRDCDSQLLTQQGDSILWNERWKLYSS